LFKALKPQKQTFENSRYDAMDFKTYVPAPIQKEEKEIGLSSKSNRRGAGDQVKKEHKIFCPYP
jgi:hypothetical protein